MKVSKIVPQKVTNAFGRQLFKMKSNSPHILFGVGLVGVVTGTVLACRATLKANEALDELHSDVAAVKRDLSDTPEYRKDLTYAYMHGTVRIVRLYAPAVIVTGVGIAALTGSHVALTKRNTALTAAYTGLQAAYDEYRNRVRAEYGEEKELDIYHAAKVEKVKEGTKNVEVRIADPNKFSPYARFFDESSTEWRKNADQNRFFITAQQNYLNNLLHARGHVYLNEAYEALGLEHCDAGSVVGWLLSEEGDNFIDFGIYEAFNSRFVNGEERSILLDFNVDGVIYGKVDGRGRKGPK